MKNLIKKFLKGYLVWMIIMLLLSVSTFLFQACSNDDNYYEEVDSVDRIAKINSFKKTMQIGGKEIKNKIETSRMSNEAVAKEFVSEIKDDALILIKSYGVTERQLINKFGSLDPEKIALTAQLIVMEEELIDKGKTLSIFTQQDYKPLSYAILGINSTYANTVGGCVLEAIGVKAVVQVLVGDIAALGTAGVLKIVGNVASKYAGIIGAAAMVYQFADCMGWLTAVSGPLPAGVSTYKDLVIVDRRENSFKATYYISKKDIGYISASEFKINRNSSYRTFNVEYGDIKNPIYKVTFGSKTVLGLDLNPLTVREIPAPISLSELER